jgi:hypothetical protein
MSISPQTPPGLLLLTCRLYLGREISRYHFRMVPGFASALIRLRMRMTALDWLMI